MGAVTTIYLSRTDTTSMKLTVGIVLALSLAFASGATTNPPKEVKGCKQKPTKKGCAEWLAYQEELQQLACEADPLAAKCPCTKNPVEGCPNYVQPTTTSTTTTTESTTTTTTTPEPSPEPTTTTGPTTTTIIPTDQTKTQPITDDPHPNKHHYNSKTDDIIRILAELHKFRRDSDEEPINGNYFVGGDFVVNNGLINHQVGGHSDTPALEIKRWAHCLIGDEKTEEMYMYHEQWKNGENMVSGDKVAAEITYGQLENIYECMGMQWMEQMQSHMEYKKDDM